MRLSMWLHAAALAITLVIVGAAANGDFPDAAKLPSRPELPDPLAMSSGKPVTTKEQWFKERRPELKKLFEHYMYGHAPAAPKIEAKVDRIDPKALGGKATLKEITITIGGVEKAKIHLLLIVPNKRTKPAPVFLGMNFAGNHTVLDDPKIRLSTAWIAGNNKGVKNNHATEESRGAQKEVWNIEQAIDRGYAIATFHTGDVDPDRADVREGIQQFFQKPGTDDWGSIAAWAWGIQRVVDYLVTDADIDASKIIVVGHSRLGKTALLAGAFDERIAMVIPLQAGCGGTAPSRGKIGESVKRINTSFPHWFNATFKQFNDQPDRLPFDQHCLLAMCAPRPVLLANAVEDTWANPAGQFEMLLAADPVYRLVGADGVASKKMPASGKLMNSTLGYFLRDGKHSMNRQDWGAFLDFADKHLGVPR